MEKISMKEIESYISTEEKFIKVGTGKNSLRINIIEDVSVDDIHAVVESISDAIVAQDFAYTLFDILLPYHIVNLFTNIEAPMIEEDVPDYEVCYKFCIQFDLVNKLAEVSPIVAEYIGVIEKNIWRTLEYKKALTALIPYESLMDALGEFYRILDDIDKIAEAQKDVDVEGLVKQLGEISAGLASVEKESQK